MRVEMEIPRALGNKAAGRDASLYMKATEEARRRVRERRRGLAGGGAIARLIGRSLARVMHARRGRGGVPGWLAS